MRHGYKGAFEMAATVDFYKAKGGLPEDGPLSVIVPGAVGGMELALQKYGTRPMGEVLAPAIDIAEVGAGGGSVARLDGGAPQPRHGLRAGMRHGRQARHGADVDDLQERVGRGLDPHHACVWLDCALQILRIGQIGIGKIKIRGATAQR